MGKVAYSRPDTRYSILDKYKKYLCFRNMHLSVLYGLGEIIRLCNQSLDIVLWKQKQDVYRKYSGKYGK